MKTTLLVLLAIWWWLTAWTTQAEAFSRSSAQPITTQCCVCVYIDTRPRCTNVCGKHWPYFAAFARDCHVSTDDLDHLIHHVQDRLLQRGSCRSTAVWTGPGAVSSTRLLGSQQMPADTTMWHSFWWIYTAFGCHNISSTSCVWRLSARLPERHSTRILLRPDSVCRQYRTSCATLSVDLWSGGTTNWRPCNGVHSPLQVLKRGTVYRQPSAQPPNRSLHSKQNLNRFFLVSHFGGANVNFDYVKHSSNSLYRTTALNKSS